MFYKSDQFRGYKNNYVHGQAKDIQETIQEIRTRKGEDRLNFMRMVLKDEVVRDLLDLNPFAVLQILLLELNYWATPPINSLMPTAKNILIRGNKQIAKIPEILEYLAKNPQENEIFKLKLEKLDAMYLYFQASDNNIHEENKMRPGSLNNLLDFLIYANLDERHNGMKGIETFCLNAFQLMEEMRPQGTAAPSFNQYQIEPKHKRLVGDGKPYVCIHQSKL